MISHILYYTNLMMHVEQAKKPFDMSFINMHVVSLGDCHIKEMYSTTDMVSFA